MLFNYATFSNNFSLCQKPYQNKNNPPRKNLEGLFIGIIPTSLSLQQVAGDRQTGHHDAHHAHQLDEDVQRRT